MLLFGTGLITLGSIAIDLQQKFQLDKIESGTLFSILPFGILLGSLVFGPICDRYGYKLFMVLACILIFIGFQGVAYAGSLIVLRICVLLIGFSGGALNGACNALVSDISVTNKSANLSLLGVFFALGALGMPLILGSLNKQFSFESIISSIGLLPILATLIIFITKFPEPKQNQKIPLSQGIELLKHPFFLLTSFYLFCQSSIEAVISNWTTTYLQHKLDCTTSNALFGLSLYVVGMAFTRILLGSIFRNTADQKIVIVSLIALGIGNVVLWTSSIYSLAIAGLVLCGVGIAAGFPVMLGLIGNRYARLSGTAFGLALTISLFGNILVNNLMGYISESYGVHHFTTIIFVALVGMGMLTLNIFRKKDLNNLSVQ